MSNPFIKSTVAVYIFLLVFSRVAIAEADAAQIQRQHHLQELLQSADAVDVAAEGIIKGSMASFYDALEGAMKEIVTDSKESSNAAEGIINEVVTDSNGFSEGLPQQKVNPEGCPVTCFRAAPVCGVNGATYWCGSKEAECDGVVVAHAGYCSLGNGGTAGRGLMAGQALLLVHMVWLILAGLLVIFGRP